MNVFDLMAKISLDKSEYTQGMNEASAEGEKTSSKLGSMLSTAGKVAGASLVAVGTAVAGVTATMVEGVSSTAQYGDHIDKMSQKIGISAEAYQEWDFIAQHCGTSVDGLQTSMKTLSTQAQSGAEEFEKLGLSMDDVQSMSQEDLFSAVITGLQGMEEGTERTALASKLLGRSATELAPLLNQSAEETEKMRKQAHDLGGVMSNEAVKASANFQDSLQNLQTAIKGLSNGAFAQFLPSATKVMDGLTAIFGGDDSGIAMVSEGVEEFTNNLLEQIPRIAEFGMRIIESLSNAILNNLPVIIETATNIILELTQALIQNLPMIIEAGMFAIITLAQGIAEALPDLMPTIVDVIITIVETLIDNVDLLIDSAIAIIMAVAEGLINSLPILIEKAPIIIEKLMTAIVTNAPKLLKASFELIMKLAEGLIQYFPTLLSKIPQLITNLKEKFISLVKGMADVGKKIVESLWDGIKGAWDWLKDKFSSMLSGLVDGLIGGLTGGGSGGSGGTGTQSLGGTSTSSYNGSQNQFGGTVQTQPQNVYVTLEGDANRLFRIVQAESSRNVQLVGG